jgi:anti-sigma28 factor (negative regulator of flagellin synthesis)
MSADTFDLDRNTDAPASPTIKVEIYDQAYTVRSDGDPDYLKELAEYVDQRMREISSGTLTVDSRKVAILAARQLLPKSASALMLSCQPSPKRIEVSIAQFLFIYRFLSPVPYDFVDRFFFV